jgi:hypothetical protein
MPRVAAYAGVMFCAQLLEHTHVGFAVLYFGFVMLSGLAFNLAGGFRRVVGAYVFFFSLLTAILGVTYKACLLEPADTNLAAPQLTMATYTLSMALLLAVVFLVKRFDVRPYSLAMKWHAEDLDYSLAGLGCIAVGLGLQLLNGIIPGGQGSLLGVINQLNGFSTLGIVLGTIGVMKETHGRRGIGFINGLGIFIVAGLGTLSFSKSGMLTPVACWLITAAYMRFRLRTVHLIVLGVVGVLTFAFIPTWATGRDDVPADGLDIPGRVVLAVYELQHFSEMKQRAADVQAQDREFGHSGFYENPEGLMDRLVMLPPDDNLISYTAKGHYYGYVPVQQDFENWIPHFILPDKPSPAGGNTYAHELGGLAPDDFSTGISFTPTAEVFHLGGWTALLLLLPTLWLMMFLVTDWVVGDIRRSFWPLISMVAYAHSAPESAMGGLIYNTAYGNLAIVVAMVFATRLAPILGALFYGRRMVLPKSAVRSTPGEGMAL